MSTDDRRLTELERDLAAAKQRIAELEQENRDLVGRLEQIVALAFSPFGTADPAKAAEHARHHGQALRRSHVPVLQQATVLAMMFRALPGSC